MICTPLIAASQQSIHRRPDERFSSLQALIDFYRESLPGSRDPCFLPPRTLKPTREQPHPKDDRFLNTESFSPSCRHIASTAPPRELSESSLRLSAG